MRVFGMLRVKNEARWIERAIRSILPLCDQVLVMDDHSDDNTPVLCASFPKVTVLQSPFSGLDETRDKNWLLERARSADWIVCIDGDEMLAPGGVETMRQAMSGNAESISMRIPYLWDSENQIRVDGVYGEFRRHSAFRPCSHVYVSNGGGGFHCGNVPAQARRRALTIDAQLLHFGYLHAADRERKYCWYNASDPANPVEDCYRHIAAGLPMSHASLVETQKRFRLLSGLPALSEQQYLPPAPSVGDRTMHAGPVQLEAI